MTRTAQWGWFIASLILMGIWFPMMFLRSDEKHMLADNFGLGLNDYDPAKPRDGVEMARARIIADPSLHNIKNYSHEWAAKRPKLAVKSLCFVICVQAVALAISIGVQ